jgi:hypothetical protein
MRSLRFNSRRHEHDEGVPTRNSTELFDPTTTTAPATTTTAAAAAAANTFVYHHHLPLPLLQSDLAGSQKSTGLTDFFLFTVLPKSF